MWKIVLFDYLHGCGMISVLISAHVSAAQCFPPGVVVDTAGILVVITSFVTCVAFSIRFVVACCCSCKCIVNIRTYMYQIAMVFLLTVHYNKVFSAPQSSRPKTCIFCFLIEEVRATTDLESPGIETRFVVKVCAWHEFSQAHTGFACVSGTCLCCDLVLHSLCTKAWRCTYISLKK